VLAALRGHAGCVATLLGHGCDPRRVSLDPLGNAYGVADAARRKNGREGAAPPHAYNEVLQLLLVSDSGIRDASEEAAAALAKERARRAQRAREQRAREERAVAEAEQKARAAVEERWAR
jgi:hypothetical protein